MADCGLLVTISGAALSLLFYENVRSVGDQMGFLLGEALVFLTKKVTDSDKQVEYVRIHIDVDTVVTCPSADLLHDSTGKINKEKLKNFVRDKSKQVVGWFRFRQNSSLVPTLRDKVLHKQFASHFTSGTASTEENFVACFLNTSVSNMGGTHKFRHVFLHHKRGVFEPVPMRINNLGADASRHDGSDYKPIPLKKRSEEPDAFSKVVDSLNLDLLKTPGVELVTAIQKAAERHLNALIPKVCESDREVADLEKQVRDLQAKILTWNAPSKIELNDNALAIKTNFPAGKEWDDDGYIRCKKNEDPVLRNTASAILHNDLGPTKYPTTIGQPIAIGKQKNSIGINVKNTNQDRERAKNMAIGKDIQGCTSHDPFANIVNEMQMEIADSVSNRTRRATASAGPGVARPVSKIDTNELSIARSKGRGNYESNPGTKKPRRTTLPKVVLEKSGNSQTLEQEHNEPNSVQNLPIGTISYSQATKKNVDTSRGLTDLPE
ncbi:BRISC complex subunit FAM175B isoform X1 [Cephus cinctus]|uniref:BRISC complex subunit FAM175B isoform X1 n=1 Tax=Cephus cinctus TaxID=211228 RepID=A0AAJ7BGE4_CEPCN|nr:BRISC complex subunit FAM175B isoform X1 [Cephus cinctus]XP_015585404.1 BRISC complex subunit FAM175B isoform X1 [Cephus cinctus]